MTEWKESIRVVYVTGSSQSKVVEGEGGGGKGRMNKRSGGVVCTNLISVGRNGGMMEL